VLQAYEKGGGNPIDSITVNIPPGEERSHDRQHLQNPGDRLSGLPVRFRFRCRLHQVQCRKPGSPVLRWASEGWFPRWRTTVDWSCFRQHRQRGYAVTCRPLTSTESSWLKPAAAGEAREKVITDLPVILGCRSDPRPLFQLHSTRSSSATRSRSEDGMKLTGGWPCRVTSHQEQISSAEGLRKEACV
jgi:hypothetical protein